MQPLRVVRATAPIRICDNGGWTDTWLARHGKVFNIAVRPVASVTVDVFARGTREARVMLNAENYGARYAPGPGPDAWGPHPLLEATLQAIPPPADVDVEVSVRSDAPAGASTGTSAAVVVALLGALDSLSGGERTPYDIAYEAHAVETSRLGGQSGIQDQLCAAFGGINFIEIVEYPRALVSQFRLPLALREELNQRLSLIYLGKPHHSSLIHEKVLRDLERAGPDDKRLEALRAAAVKARDAAIAGEFDALGRAMRDNTDAQAALHPDLVSDDFKRVIDIARAHGAAGWKVNGAGGDGGSITLLGNGQPTHKKAMLMTIRQALPGCTQIPISLSDEGLRVWTPDES